MENSTEKKMLLKIQGNRTQNGDKENVEFITEALFRREQEGYSVEYRETEVTGMEGTITLIQFRPKEISISRRGMTNSHLQFEEGTKHLTMYETEAGMLSMGVIAENVFVQIDENGGRADFDYQLEINDVPASENHFTMKIWEVS